MYNVNNQLLNDFVKTIDDGSIDELTDKLSKFKWKKSIVENAKNLLYSENIEENIKGVLNLKSMLCIEREEVYEVAQEVIDHGIISRLVQFLKVDNRDLQLPAAFCLTNIAAGHDTQTQNVVDAGAIPCLIEFLKHSDSQLRRQAIYCLANVAGSTREFRILLAQDPNYFDAIIHAGSMTLDVRVLELVCWNLRNVCLLGGPQIEDIKPGIDYFINGILKRYVHNHAWIGCLKYAIETIANLCRTPDGRNLIIQHDLTECLMEVINEHCDTCSQLVESALEALSLILLWGSSRNRIIFSQNKALANILIKKALVGELGPTCQECSLKCIIALTLETDENVLLVFISYNHDFYDLIGQLYISLYQQPNTLNKNSINNVAQVADLREMCAYLFVKALNLSRHLISVHIKLLLSPMVIKLILNILEFSVEREYIQDGLSKNKYVFPIKLVDTILTCSLKVLKDYISEGYILQSSENLPENPVLSNCNSNNYVNCLREIILKAPLSEEAYTLCTEILQKG